MGLPPSQGQYVKSFGFICKWQNEPNSFFNNPWKMVAFEVIAPKMESSSISVVSIKPSLVGFRKWVNPSLGGTIKNHIKEWLRNQK
jgi:hypothetical protein